MRDMEKSNERKIEGKKENKMYGLVRLDPQWAGTAGARHCMSVKTVVAKEATLALLTVVTGCVVLAALMDREKNTMTDND